MTATTDRPAAANEPVRVTRADGSILSVERDDRRRELVLTDDDGLLLALRADGDRVVGHDRHGTTSARRSGASTRVERRSGDRPPGRAAAPMVLRIDRDGNGRPRRVTLPGSTSDLHVRAAGAGQWRFETDEGTPILDVSAVGPHDRTILLADGWGWRERAGAGAVTSAPTDGGDGVTSQLDRGGRVVGRIGIDGTRHRYARDRRQRLVAWSGTREVRWHFSRPVDDASCARGDDHDSDVLDGIVAITDGGRRRRVRRDEGGRTTALVGGGRPTLRFDYDAVGRRTTRRAAGRTTRYRYDSLDQLVAIEHPDGRRTEMGWDALGRRVWIAESGERLDEHRDVDGRLWAVTDADGRAVHTFLWWDDRVIARLDGPVGSPVAEAYLTDPVGTLLAVATPRGDGRWELEDAIGSPYGEITAAYRPTLFGHISDRWSGLICFGCRLLDPETASFITPDPWHGGPDDPRLLAGATAQELSRWQELPRSGIHPVALSQFDPLSRPDLDGHFAWGNFFLGLVLAPTWGWPMTSISLFFFFFPLDLYFELFGLIAYIFTDHPWPQHSMANMKGLAGSTNLGTAALALNGFIPRATAGSDRAVTIGHVAWENRRYFELLDRPRVLMVENISGPPTGPGGAPVTTDPTAFSQTAAGSIVVVESIDEDNRRWIHGSWWTRGGGNHVGERGGRQVFEDRKRHSGDSHASGSLLLAQPMPEGMATPRSSDDEARLTVTEYLHEPTLDSEGEIVRDQWFAIAVDSDAGFTAGDAVRVRVDDEAVAPAFAGVQRVIAGDRPILLLDTELPQRFHPKELADEIELTKLTAASGSSAGASTGWTAAPVTADTPADRSLVHSGPNHRLRVDDVVAITPSSPPATERPVVYGQIATVLVGLDLAIAPPPTVGGHRLFLLTPDGTVVRGFVPDPAGAPATVALSGDHDLEVDDMIVVRPATGPGVHYAVVTNISPAAGDDPATVTVDPPIPAGVVTTPGAPVRLARLRTADRDRDAGQITDVSGATVTVTARSNAVFPVGAPVLVEVGADLVVRTVGAISSTTIVLLEDEMVPDPASTATGPFAVELQAMVHDDHDGAIAADRFVKHVGTGPRPSASTFHDWPTMIMGLVPEAYPDNTATPPTTRGRQPLGWRFFVKPPGAPSDLHPDYREFWQPFSVGGDEYWVLSSPLRLAEDDGRLLWEPDLDDTFPRRHTQDVGPTTSTGVRVKVRSFATSTTTTTRSAPVTRPLAGGARVLCRPAETQVPDEPRIRFSLADALDEHELAHTVQNVYWGPLLTGLPLQGLFRSVGDLRTAAGSSSDWLDDLQLMSVLRDWFDLPDDTGFDDLNVFEVFSIGGLMQIIGTFIFLGPFLAFDDVRKFLLDLDYSDFAQVVNPVNQQIINHVPEVDPDLPADERWGLYFANLAARAADLRAWTPVVGLVPHLLPDNATNPLEQQASRWTGDLYSNIVTVNDRHNYTVRSRYGVLNDNREADQTIPLGRVARVMVFLNALDRYLKLDGCDAPTQLVQLTERQLYGGLREFQIELLAPDPPPAGTPPPALLCEDLIEHGTTLTTPATTLGRRRVDGPLDPSTGSRTGPFDFVEVPVGTKLRPTLRSMTPVGPAVTRAFGFYLVPASVGRYKITAWDRDSAALPDREAHQDPLTYTATVTVAGEVKIDDAEVEWVMPLATGATTPPGALPSGDVSRIVTQTARLTVTDQDTSEWIAEADGAVGVERIAGGGGWKLVFGDPGAGFPVRNRVRIWRPVRGDDPDLFDFEHRDEPTRVGLRSYIEDDIWIPVRDFSVETTDLPTLADATIAAADRHVRDLPLDVAGAASIVVTPNGGRTLDHELDQGDDRMDLWRFELDGVKALESALVFNVRITFGSGSVTMDRAFDLTVEPNFTIDTPAPGGPYVVTEAGGPLTLEVDGGSAPFAVESELPAGVSASVSGSTITLTADDAARAGSHVLVVRDADDRLGIRSVRVEL